MTRFLNLDLEIRTAARPRALIAEMRSKAFLLHAGATRDGFLTVVEIAGRSRRPATLMVQFARLLAGLGPRALRQYHNAGERRFVLGYATRNDRCAEFEIPRQVSAQAAALNGILAIAVYDGGGRPNRDGRPGPGGHAGPPSRRDA